MMKNIEFFLDSANLSEVKRAISLGFFSGLTTNPVILSKESKNYKDHVLKLLKIIPQDWDISLEINADNNLDSMLRQAEHLLKWDKRIRIKIPVTSTGFLLAKKLIKDSKLNLTIIKNSAQAHFCQAMAIQDKAKDIMISLFCNRISQAGYNWTNILREITNVEWPGKVIAASIKTPLDISVAISNGADIVTAPFETYQLALDSRLTKEDLDVFNSVFDNKKFKI